MTIVVETPPDRSAQDAAGRREAQSYAVFMVWIVSGLVLDGWSHNTSRPETFFTPWHGLLYSGFLAAAAWGAVDGARQRRAGRDSVLVDRWSRLGVVTFAVGMVGDFAWHQVLGIEVGVDALLSPTHLLLFTGGLCLATTALRASLRGIDVGAVPVVVSAAATATVTGFFSMYLTAFRGTVAGDATAVTGHHGVPELRNVHGIGAILLTTVVFVGVLVVAGRATALPLGGRTAIVAIAAIGLNALDGFDRPALLLAALAGGVAADAVARVGHGRLAGVAFAAVVWPAWFAALKATGPMVWNAELWSGTCVLAVLLACGVTLLTELPPVRPAGRP